MIEFAAMIVAVVECLPNSKAGNHISNPARLQRPITERRNAQSLGRISSIS